MEQVISESIVACSDPKYGHLLMASEQVVWIVSVGVGVVLFQKILLFGLYNRFNFRICVRSVIMLCLPLQEYLRSHCHGCRSETGSIGGLLYARLFRSVSLPVCRA